MCLVGSILIWEMLGNVGAQRKLHLELKNAMNPSLYISSLIISVGNNWQIIIYEYMHRVVIKIK